MSHIFVPNGIRITFQCEDDTNLTELLHVFHCTSPTIPPDYATCLAVAGEVADWWTNFYRSLCPANIIGRQVVATGMNAVPAAQATVVMSTPGTITTESNPNSVSLALKLATNLMGRRHRGRVYTFPSAMIALNSLDPNKFSAAYVAAAIGVFTTLGSRINAASCVWGIFSPTDGTIYPISRVVAVDDVVDNQRRRLPERGR